jgi:hypothetical protein
MGLLESSLEVVKLAGKIANPELVQAATQANIEALEVSMKNVELQKQLTALEALLKDLEEKLKLRGEIFREGDYVFLDGDPMGFCSRCWDVDRRLVHILRMDIGVGRGFANGCPQCKTSSRLSAQNPRMKNARSLESTEHEQCPKCHKRTWELVKSLPDPTIGQAGLIRRSYKCSECAFSEEKLITPQT